MFERIRLRRWFVSAILCALAVVMLGAGGSDPSDRYGRIGHNLMCVCGCNQILLECNHVGCPDSSRMIGELQEQFASANAGGSDSLIMNWFVAKYGATVLAAPMRGGFDNVAWIVPITAFILAIFGTAFLVRMWSAKQRTVLAGAAPTVVNDALREKIRRETEW